MKITITGTPGSGKSTLGKQLAEHYGLKFLSAGEIYRQIARDRKISLQELSKLSEKEDWVDKELDNYVKVYGLENDDFVVEGRLAWHFIPDSIKIFLDADEKERAERMLGRRKPEESFEEVKDVMKANREMIKSNKKRYREYYGIDYYNLDNYDLVLNSTGKTPEKTLKEAIAKINKFK